MTYEKIELQLKGSTLKYNGINPNGNSVMETFPFNTLILSYGKYEGKCGYILSAQWSPSLKITGHCKLTLEHAYHSLISEINTANNKWYLTL